MGSKGGTPKEDPKPLDDSKTQPSIRGTLLPYILGCARIGGVFGAVGSRRTYEIMDAPGQGGGGKGGGDEPEPTYTTYYRENGWHLMCQGRGRSIKVYNSEGVQSGELSRSSYPSGSTISLGTNGANGDMGVFKVYWGEDTQPVNSFLSSKLGIASRFPHVFSIVWSPRELGTTATWPSQEFAVEVDCQKDTIGGQPTYIKTSTLSGVNPAAALWQMLFEYPPYGLGLVQDTYNQDDFTALAERFAVDGPEPFPCSVRLSAGTSFKEGITQVLEDAGISWWFDQTIGKHRLTAVRAQEVTETITGDDSQESDLDMTFDYAVMNPKNTIYAFEDRNRNFYRSTLRKSDDGALKLCEDPTASKEDLHTVTDYTTANMVASRRAQESIPRETIPLTLSSKYMNIKMDGLYNIEGLPYSYRIQTVEPNTKNFTNKVLFVRDVYSISNDYENIDQEVIDNGLLDPEEDLAPVLLETNRAISPDKNGVFFLKIRAHEQTVSSTLITSPDDSTYISANGIAIYATGGSLNTDIPQRTGGLIEQGPTITNLGPDILEVSDLTSSESFWRSGSQLCIIGGEIFYLRGITALSATEYRLDGLIRARLGTEPELHNTGDTVYILPSSAYIMTTPTFLTKGADIFMKSMPRTSTGQLQPDDVTATSLSYLGGGNRPLEVTNLTTENMGAYWLEEDDVSIRWSYRNYSGAAAAGKLLTGVASVSSDPEGTFAVEISDGTNVKRTITDLTSPKYTYLNADMVADFGVEPSVFYVTVIAVLEGVASDEVTTTISKYGAI